MRLKHPYLAAIGAVLMVAQIKAAAPPSKPGYQINVPVSSYLAPNFVPSQVPMWLDTTTTMTNPDGTTFSLPRPVSDQSPLPAVDANSAAFQGVIAITPGTATTAERSLGFICTTSGTVTLTLADGSTITLGLIASSAFQSLPFAVTNVALGSGTAGTFWGLK